MIFLVKILAFVFAWVCVQSNNQRDKLFFLQKSAGESNETLLVVTWTEKEDENATGCEFFTDRELITEVLKSSDESPIRTLSEDEMQNLLVDCKEINLRRRKREAEESPVRRAILPRGVSEDNDELFRRRSSTRQTEAPRRAANNRELEDDPNGNETETTEPTTTMGYDGMPVIFPGTKWCGAGDLAENYDDLGRYDDTDRCCRAHDLCNDTLAPGETRNNLTNKSSFTKLSCECDVEFYNCLDKVNSVPSNTIGNMYFNLLRRDCYTMDYPTTNKCKTYRSFLKITCSEYEKDTSGNMTYQWVKAQTYKKIPVPGPLTVNLPF